MKTAAFAAASAALFQAVSAKSESKIIFSEDFNSGDFSSWTVPDRENLGSFKLSPGKFYKDEEDYGLQTVDDARFYGIAKEFAEPFDNKGDTLVVQLSVKHEQDIDCGGGYVKVYGKDVDLESLDGDSPYAIMFGPDICGSKKMVHVIFSHNGENHLISKLIKPATDVFSHSYTLIVEPDNTYSVLVDNKEEASGSIEDDWTILPPKLIKDPEASKPSDWVDAATIDDPESTKPDDWEDVPATIPDPSAEKPEDWDDDMDGEYEVPMVPNPAYAGEWTPEQIPNPDYKGPWEHPLIANPEFEADPSLYEYVIGAIGIDVWQVKSGTIFDDLLVTNDAKVASDAAEKIIERAAAEKEAKAADDLVRAEEAKKEKERMEAENSKDFQDEDDDEDEEEEDDEKDEL